MILNQEQQKVVIQKVNDRINLPVLGEKAERAIFKFALKRLLKKLEEELPEDLVEFLDTTADGIVPGGEESLKEVKEGIVNYLNDKVDIPILGEKGERQFISAVIDILFDAMQKEKSI